MISSRRWGDGVVSTQIVYNFEVEGGQAWNYPLSFDDSHNFIAKPDTEIRPWTRLEYHQCSHCPLNKTKSPQCPVAKNLNQIVEDTNASVSYTPTRVTVVTPERTYTKQCTAQDGLRSLFGLIMATSGCPHLEWLRPLARFHLPFATLDETLFRVLSLQLLDDYLNDHQIDFESVAAKIKMRYGLIEKVNQAFADRIRSYCKADADKNAIAQLDVYAQMFPFQLEDDFKSLRKYFGSVA